MNSQSVFLSQRKKQIVPKSSARYKFDPTSRQSLVKTMIGPQPAGIPESLVSKSVNLRNFLRHNKMRQVAIKGGIGGNSQIHDSLSTVK